MKFYKKEKQETYLKLDKLDFDTDKLKNNFR